MRMVNEALERLEILVLESPVGQRLLAWYRRLPDRDQAACRSVVMGALILLPLLTLVLPATRFALGQLSSYQQARADYQWFTAQETAARRAAASLARDGDTQQLQQQLAGAAEAHHLSLKRYQTVEDGSLRVWIESVAFDDLVHWVQVLADQHQLQLAALSVTPAAREGTVNVRMDIRT